MLPRTEWRCHHVFGPLKLWLFVFFFSKKQIMRARLGIDAESCVARLNYRRKGFRGRQMNYVHWGARQLCEPDRPMRGLALHRRRPSEGMIFRCSLASSYSFVDENLYDSAVFGVHTNHRAITSRNPHGLEERTVIYHQYVGISGKQFETGHALAFDKRLHVRKHVRVDIQYDHVCRDVNTRALSATSPVC